MIIIFDDQKLFEHLAKLESMMSQLSDAIASVQTSADAAVARVNTDLTNLNAQIVALEAQIAAGGATPADIAALAALKAEFDGLDFTNPAVLAPAVIKAAVAKAGK